MLKEEDPSKVSNITSRLISIEGAQGLRILGYVDEGRGEVWNERFIILAPRYGETKKNNLQLSYFLVANGFKVLRFDQTNHIGESDGSMKNFTIPAVVEDILAVVDYVDDSFEASEVILVTQSLSARCGYRACALSPKIDRFVSLVGMVDMLGTLRAIYNPEVIDRIASGSDCESIDILGFEINGNYFRERLFESKMEDLSGCLVDAAAIGVPVLHLHAQNDLWVLEEDVQKVVSSCSNSKLVIIPGVGHEVNAESHAVEFAMGEILLFCSQGIDTLHVHLLPDKKKLLHQNKLERGRLQQALAVVDEENFFWEDYLGKFGIIESAGHYVDYFRCMSELLGRINQSDLILDAGCGNGFYGVCILRNLIRENKVSGELPRSVHYYAIDFSAGGLHRSYSRHVEELIDFDKADMSSSLNLGMSYRKVDFENPERVDACLSEIADGSVNKICCSLVVSYLKQPLRIFLEFHRVLTSGGVAVVSSMKPGCDLTVLYHDSLSSDYSEDNDRDATQLLSAAGQIKLKRDLGIYSFYTGQELAELALEAGFKKISISNSLGGQANIVKIIK